MLKKVVIECPECGTKQYANNLKNENSAEVHCCKCKCSILVDFNDETILGKKPDKAESIVELSHNGESFSLSTVRSAEYTIGRKSESERKYADIEISTGNDKSVSRVHCKIEVYVLSNGRVKVIICDARDENKIKQECTKINGDLLLYRERIVLRDGDRIKMGHQTVEVTLKGL